MVLRSFFLTAFLGLAVLTAQAQGRPEPKEMAQRQTDWMKTNLNLDARQLARVDSLNQVYATKTSELVANGFTDETREKMRALTQEKETHLKPMLTADQWKIYDERKAEMRRRPN